MFWGTEQANRHGITEGPSAVFRELNETCRAGEFPYAVPSREFNDVAVAAYHIRDACTRWFKYDRVTVCPGHI